MKYSQLITFDPIETTIQLIESKDKKEAAKLVRTYVMSDQMAVNLTAPVIDQLQLDEAMDNKGVMIVGNYGTGKSHLMSLISAIAADADNLQYVTNKKFADDVKRIAGRFEVLRMEVGGVTMPLREIICEYIQDDFNERGIAFKMPDLDKVKDNKALIREIMEAFDGKYPGKGYMIVIDELLAYLQSRDHHQIVLDLEFYRALGEMCSKSKIRIMSGVQEKIFDNPKFSFVSDTLRHVSDRFTQLVITKEDTAFVASERILKKSPQQKAMIREHLQKFSSLYEGMSTSMESYVDMFPIHPAYIDVFNRLYLIEQRHVLKNISVVIRDIFNQDVPANAPGIISFDNYWPAIKNDGLLKSDATIRKVVESSGKLEDIVNRGITKKTYKPMAMQIINALSVHRLTTSSIDLKFGLTAKQLKDDLCLFTMMPEMDSDFLQGAVEATMKEIMNVTLGQFIVHNTSNDQYYIDTEGTDKDADLIIAQKAETVSASDLNRYYYQVVYSCMEWGDKKQYVTNFNIYEYDLNWNSHNIYREGYLFMGLPGERSTAQPERDFYIHFMPPFGFDSATPQHLDDEVYLYFKSSDSFKVMLGLYAAADMLANESSNGSKDKGRFQTRAIEHRKKLIKDLSENKNTVYDVEYKHTRKKLIEVLGGKYNASSTFKDVVDLCASTCFDIYFNGKYPEFPVMQTKITRANMANTVREAIDHFAGRKTKLSASMLNSFGVLDSDGKIRPEGSKYAAYYIDRIKKLPPQGVLNYSDIFEANAADEYFDKKYHVSFMFMPIVFLSLVYGGHAVITLKNGKLLTASDLDQTAKMNASDFYTFKYISRPAQSSLAEMKKLFEVIDLNPVLLDNPNTKDSAVAQLLQKAQQLANTAVITKNQLTDFSLWNEGLVTPGQLTDMKVACDAVRDEFSNYSAKYNTPAKLGNFSHSISEVEKLGEQIKLIVIIGEYATFKNYCTSVVSYISNIESFDLGATFHTGMEIAKDSFRKTRDSIFNGVSADTAANAVKAQLEKVKDEYIKYYFDAHQKKRLGISDAKRRGEIQESSRFANLRKLKGLDFISASKYTGLISEMADLKICYELTADELRASPVCPHCKYSLNDKDANTYGKLDHIEDGLETVEAEWTQTIMDTVTDPTLADQKKYLTAAQKKVIDDIISTGKLPAKIDDFFLASVNALMQSIEPVIIDTKELMQKLEQLAPLDAASFMSKLTSIINSYTAGKDASTLRIIVKNSEE